jgi:DNA-binding NarL/FixJ family response regulator
MGAKLKVLVVEDEAFTRQLVENALSQQGFSVTSCENASEAIVLVKQEEPHVVISDLDLGKGPTGVDLMNLISREFPWIGLVTMSAHSAPVLVGGGQIPDGIPYLVKSQINNLEEIGEAIYKSISNLDPKTFGLQDLRDQSSEAVFFVSAGQAEILRLIAKGFSNQAIADERGTSLRAVETMIQRVYQGLGLNRNSGQNNRVEAVSLWHQGKIKVR